MSPTLGGGGSAKIWRYSVSLFRKMGNMANGWCHLWMAPLEDTVAWTSYGNVIIIIIFSLKIIVLLLCCCYYCVGLHVVINFDPGQNWWRIQNHVAIITDHLIFEIVFATKVFSTTQQYYELNYFSNWIFILKLFLQSISTRYFLMVQYFKSSSLCVCIRQVNSSSSRT